MLQPGRPRRCPPRPAALLRLQPDLWEALPEVCGDRCPGSPERPQSRSLDFLEVLEYFFIVVSDVVWVLHCGPRGPGVLQEGRDRAVQGAVLGLGLGQLGVLLEKVAP